MSYITQKKIAAAFKTLMVEEPFSKISVTMIMTHAQIRRQTFYDYFPDKFALLAWLYDQEIGEQIDDNLNYVDWPQILEALFLYFDQNRQFYQNALSIKGQNSFEGYFMQHIRQLINHIIKQMITVHQLKLSTNYQKFLLNYLSGALVAFTSNWLQSRHPESVKQVTTELKITLTDTINGLLLRTGHLSTDLTN